MPNVDNHVVRMVFDSAAFQRGTSAALRALEGLKTGISNISKGAGKLSSINIKTNTDGLGPLSQGVDQLATKFSALQVAGITAISTIAHQAIQSGLQIGKSLTIGPVGEGFSDYNAKLTSVRTVMNSTGESLGDVNKQFEFLDEYADTTVFRLGDMTSAFAKFTNAGIGIKEAIPSIKGIGNLTALAGQGADSAQIAYYNLSQSLAGGFLSRIDFKSLELANVATKGFKQELIQGALAAGTLKKGTDGMYNIPGSKKAFTEQSLFIDGLQEQFIKSDTLQKVLAKYADTTTALGKKAQAAAQDVKSLPQLMDTLKASVGTQFTTTFELLLGNVEESTVLFTGLSKVISGIVGSSGKARNELLKVWKSLGGRTVLIDGIKNAFKALTAIIKPIGDAFRNIFPRTTGKQLFDLTVKFRDFTKGLIASKETSDNIKRSFQGLFSIFKIALALFTGLGKGIFKIFGIVGKGAGGGISSLLEFTAVAGDFITRIQQWLTQTGAIESFFDVLTSPLKVLRPTVEIMVLLAKAFANLLTGDVSGFKNGLKAVGDTFKNLFGNVLEGYHKFTETLSFGLDNIAGFFGQLRNRALNSGNAFTAAIASFVVKAAEKLSEFADNVGVAISRVISKLTGATTEGKNFFKGFGSGALDKIVELVGTLSDKFGELKEKVDFGPIFERFNNGATQAAVGGGTALAGAGAVIASVFGGIKDTIGAVGDFLGPFFSGLFDVIGTIGSKIKEYVSGLDAQEIIALINTGFLFLLLKSITGFVKDFGGAAKSIGGTFDSVTGSLSAMQNALKASIIVQIGIAIAVVVAALFVLAKIDPKALGIALGALAVIFAEMAALMKIIKVINPEAMVGTGLAMVAMATAVLILAGAIKVLGQMDPKELTQGGLAIAFIFAAMAGMAKLVTFAPGILASSAALLILSFALVTMAGTIALYAALPFSLIAEGIGAMAFALVGIGLAMRAFPKGMIQKAAGITILAFAMALLLPVIAALGLLPFKVLAKGIGAMAVALLILAIAANAMNGALPGAAAMVLMAGAISVLGTALAALGQLPIGVIKKGLIVIAGLMLIFVGAMYLLTPVIVVMALFSSSLLILGAAILVAATGFAVFVAALGLLTVVGTAGFAILGLGIISIIQLFPLFAQQFGYAIDAFFEVLANIAPDVARNVGEIVMAFVEEIERRIPEIAASGLRMIIGFLGAVRDHIPAIVNVVIDIVVAFITAITERLPQMIQAGLNFVISFIEGLADAIRGEKDRTGEAGADLAHALIEGLVAGLEASGRIIKEEMIKLKDRIVGFFKEQMGINSPSTVFAELGGFIIQGLADGVGNAFGIAKRAIEELASRLPGWMKKILGIKSPSTVFAEIGMFSGKGLAQGIDNSSGMVEGSATSLGESAVSAMQNSLNALSNITAENLDMNPTITPVFDLTDVKKGSSFLNGMLNVDPVSVSATVTRATDASIGYNANQSLSTTNSLQMQRDMQAMVASLAAKNTKSETQPVAPRPVQFNIGTIQDGDSLLRRARATNRMLSLAEGGDSAQLERIL